MYYVLFKQNYQDIIAFLYFIGQSEINTNLTTILLKGIIFRALNYTVITLLWKARFELCDYSNFSLSVFLQKLVYRDRTVSTHYCRGRVLSSHRQCSPCRLSSTISIGLSATHWIPCGLSTTLVLSDLVRLVWFLCEFQNYYY
jgi:hypothetical protein